MTIAMLTAIRMIAIAKHSHGTGLPRRPVWKIPSRSGVPPLSRTRSRRAGLSLTMAPVDDAIDSEINWRGGNAAVVADCVRLCWSRGQKSSGRISTPPPAASIRALRRQTHPFAPSLPLL